MTNLKRGIEDEPIDAAQRVNSGWRDLAEGMSLSRATRQAVTAGAVLEIVIGAA